MSTLVSVKVRGKEVRVRRVHRTDFKQAHPDAYLCIEAGNRPIPSDFHVDDRGNAFVYFEGLLPEVLRWDGRAWRKVK